MVWRITVTRCRNTITENKLTSTFASRDKMAGDAPSHARGWRSATESSWTLWHAGGSRQGHPRNTSASTVGGPGWPETRFTRHHQNDKTKVTAPRLAYQLFGHSCGECYRVGRAFRQGLVALVLERRKNQSNSRVGGTSSGAHTAQGLVRSTRARTRTQC